MGEPEYKVLFLESSGHDLEAIASHIALDNPEGAKRFGMALIEAAESLALHPFMGKPYTRSNKPNLRSIVHGEYYIIYKVLESERVIEIWSFWHGSQMPPEF